MGATLVLSQTELAVEPGHEVSVDIEVRSTTLVVDQFELQVLGPAAAWATAEPAELSLLPGAKGRATVTFAVPRSSSVEAGSIPFAVKVASSEDKERPVVEEGSLVVGPYDDLHADLVPRTSSGVRAGRHELAFDNHGNIPVAGALAATDPDLLLHFEFEPGELAVEPGMAEFAQLRVRPRKALWRGPPQPRPFQVVVAVAGREPVTAEGVFLQKPRIPTAAFKMMVLAVVVGLALALLWVAVLKPTVKSAATEAVSEPLAEQAAQTADLASRQTEAGIGVEGSTLEALADTGAKSVIGDAAAAMNSFGLRLSVDGAGSVEKSFTVPAGKVFALTDLIFQNPAGDEGFLEFRRDDEVLLRNALVNFRDLDFHYVSPILFTAGRKAVLHVDCKGPANCTPAVSMAGTLRNQDGSAPQVPADAISAQVADRSRGPQGPVGVAGQAGPAGAAGPAGPPGLSGLIVVSARTPTAGFDSRDHKDVIATCPADTVLIGTGFDLDGPLASGGRVTMDQAAPISATQVHAGAYEVAPGTGEGWSLSVIAFCAKVAP